MNKYNKYGQELNTHDVLKFTAIILMLIDHVGAFFFPDELTLRVIGRLCIPMWFFLIGYVSTTKIGYELIFYAVLLLIADAYMGYNLIPLNILITFIACRYTLQVIDKNRDLAKAIVPITIGCLIWLLPSSLLFAYGTQGLLFVILGRLVRENKFEDWFIYVAAITFVVAQHLDIDFRFFDSILLFLGVFAVLYILKTFKMKTYGVSPIYAPVKLISRYSLFFYVFHLILLKWIYIEYIGVL